MQEEIFYWREWLEHWIDGIFVQVSLQASCPSGPGARSRARLSIETQVRLALEPPPDPLPLG